MAQAKKVTRLKQIDAERVDGVKDPANGFPILMMKSVVVSATGANADAPSTAAKAVNAQGGIDEKPDIAGAQGVIVDLFKLIASEAQEGATGAFGELYDIQMLCEALCAMKCFLSMERGGDEDDGEPMYKARAENAESLIGYVLKRKFSAARRKELASEGKALSDGSYPIENEEDLHNAAILARSGHGDVAAAKRLIARRAKELGVANPLAAQKETGQPEAEEAPEQEVEKTSAPGEAPVDASDVDEAYKEAVTKATAPLEAAIGELRDELAKLKATPIPGGPALTAPADARATAAKAENLAKAAYYERQAALCENNRELSKYYLEKAKEAREA